jgi:hypothetical protein
MSKRAATATAAIVLTVLLGWGAMVSWPVDPSGYQDRVVKIADGALSTVRTVAIVARADRAHRLLPPYVSRMITSAREDLASCQHDLTTESVSDPRSARLRGQLAPLLERAAALLSDDAGAMAAAADLDRVGDQLDAFKERYR